LVNAKLVGRCGLYCGACAIYRAYKDNGEYLAKLANTSNSHQKKCDAKAAWL
jgi:hypothetical protein